MARKPTELRPIMTRIPEGLRHRLERVAAKNDRSMNAEIIHRLEQSFEREDRAAEHAELIRQVTQAATVASENLARTVIAEIVPAGGFQPRNTGEKS